MKLVCSLELFKFVLMTGLDLKNMKHNTYTSHTVFNDTLNFEIEINQYKQNL